MEATIEIQDLHKSFKRLDVLKGVDITFDKPGIYAVLGPNASGKTTLIKTILGMVIPQKGSVKVMNEDIRNKYQYRENISYLPQIARFPENLKVKELFKLIQNLQTRHGETSELIREFKLEPYLDKKLVSLSGGTKQKVNVVLTFMYDNPIIILDEPTSGLDPVAMVYLKKRIKKEREKGKIILITTHIMQLVEEIADEIVFLMEGNIFFKGSIDKLKEKHGGETIELAIANILSKEGN
jgi:Cu-processing system ATP-binding protein